MILQIYFDIILYANLALKFLTILILIVLAIIIGFVTLQKKLEPGCSKDFSIVFIICIVIFMFSRIISLFIIESNNSLVYILLSFSMEIERLNLFDLSLKWIVNSLKLIVDNVLLNYFDGL